MQIRSRSLSLMLCAFFLSFVVVPHGASAATVPALTAFEEAWAHVNDYTVTVHAREVQGGDTQSRTYQYWFKKPHQAKTLIVDGDGRGSGGVWAGGDQVSGHQGGFLSHFHLKVGIHDHRATSLRGYTIPDGLINNQVNQYHTTKGELTQKAGAGDTEEVDLKVANPTSSGPEAGVTKMTIFFSKSTHMPVRQIRYAGDKVVTDETWSDLKLNQNLGDGEFPF